MTFNYNILQPKIPNQIQLSDFSDGDQLIKYCLQRPITVFTGKEKQKLEETFNNYINQGIQKGYDDKYATRDIESRLTLILNGYYWEMGIAKFVTNTLRRRSRGMLTGGAEFGSDFEYLFPNPDKPASVEAKNYANLQSLQKYLPGKTHSSLYILANLREEGRLILLCKLTKKDIDNNISEIIPGYKEIKPWFFLNNIPIKQFCGSFKVKQEAEKIIIYRPTPYVEV